MYYMSTHKASVIIPKVGLGLFIIFGLLIAMMPILSHIAPNIVSATKGASRWIKLPGFSISPVEFFKIGFVYFFAWSFSRKLIDQTSRKKSYKDELLTVIPHLVLFGLITIFIAYYQKDLGNIVLMFTIMLIMLYFANVNWKVIATLISLAISSIIFLIVIAPHRVKRISEWYGNIQDTILQFLPPELAQSLKITHFSEQYQVLQSLSAIHNGGFFGTGIGNGNLKLGFLSEVHTDFVLAGIAEETGLFGILIISILILTMIYRILVISMKVNNPTYKLFIVGVAMMIIIAFIINSFGITNMIPIKGIAVPLLSYGGSSLLATSIAIGLVLAMSSEIKELEKEYHR
jgi:cell division protein FtsW